jgi:hypothetical protein
MGWREFLGRPPEWRSTYAVANGTSNAGPVVPGVAALVLSVRPDLDAIGLKDFLMRRGMPLSSLLGLVACGCVVNAYRAVTLAASRGAN